LSPLLQAAENQQLKDQLQIIKPLLKATAKQLGLPEGPALLHLQHLQDENKQLQQQSAELLTEQIRLQESELQLWQTQQQLRDALQQVEELKEKQETCEAQLQDAESDKTALIDYVQVMSL
jgi:DNA repair exonuclease SbcCD ATPase subunit